MDNSKAPQDNPERITLKAIAKVTGYTTATVSMALRNKEQINANTRRKIQAAARRMGYAPDPAITELMYRLRAENAPQRKATIALASMFTRTQHQRNAHLAIGTRSLKEAAAAYGYGLEIFYLDDYATRPGSLERILTARGVRGL
ncbi:MAG TPA: LacI family DNA-binding transcriptional regulator, partial [Oceanipulchritudo sp.]|nr:LacI family DNA-binding transcriptional regulator [Oceanipulchritudo sp.]